MDIYKHETKVDKLACKNNKSANLKTRRIRNGSDFKTSDSEILKCPGTVKIHLQFIEFKRSNVPKPYLFLAGSVYVGHV